MQKTIVNNSGSKVGIFYPITCKLVLESGKVLKMDKSTFLSYCDDMEWKTL